MPRRARPPKAWWTIPAVLASLAGACGPPPVGEAAAGHDLVARLSLATIHAETRRIDFGTPRARQFLEHGWSWDEAAGAGLVWAVGDRSSLRFFVTAARDLPVVFRCAPNEGPDGEAQVLGVAVNGRSVAELELAPDLDEYRMTLPAGALVAGWNRLEFSHRHWAAGPKIRRLAVRWDSIRLGDDEPQEPPPRAQAKGRRIRLPFGVQVDYTLRLSAAAKLEITELAADSPGAGRLEVLLQGEGDNEELRATLSPGRELMVDLGPEATGVGRLSLRAVGRTSAGGLTLTRPRVTPGPDDGGGPRPNVIVYLIDALRADHLGAYGYPRPVSPNIDAFAAEALVFADAIAQSSWTKPAVASLFTGMLPPTHGVLLREHALSPRAATLAEVLLAAGYRTAAFSTNPFVSRSFGLDQGFVDFVYLDAGREGTHHAFSDRVNDEVLGWLDSSAREPFFLYVHTVDPHAPYTPPLPDGGYGGGVSPPPLPSCSEQQPMPEMARRQMLERYDAEIAFNDASFGALVEALRRRDLYDESLIVLLSDHGEAFWEHRGWAHENFLYAEVLGIPLILKPPRGPVVAAADGLAQQIDVLPTILDLLRLPVPAQAEGRTLLAGRGERAPRAGFAYLECPSGKRLEAVLAGPWKLIRTTRRDGSVDRVELYHRRRDAGELVDESEARPEVVRRLSGLLDARGRARPLEPVRAQIGTELAESLRALGYVD